MDALRIIGNGPLQGSIAVSGAKNAALPLMMLGLMTGEELKLTRVPDLADIRTTSQLLVQHGTKVSPLENSVLTLSTPQLENHVAPYELVKTMRASILVLGPLLARFGKARVSLPGGCAIGSRPVDMHLKAMEKLGATIEVTEGYVEATVNGRLQGGDIAFDKVSVGATENALMAAVLAEGDTTITNAAQEPEITDLAHCLVKMGAKIEGIGTACLRITGVSKLHGAEHAVVADRIEAGSFAIAAAITGGSLFLENIDLSLLGSVRDKLQNQGVTMVNHDGGLQVLGTRHLKPTDIATAPFPSFPTDMQAQFMALLALADGTSTITETIFENRFMHVPELVRMGCDIQVKGRSAIIRGVKKLKGAQVMATDLRASMSLILAALSAEGETTVHRIYHLDRGYEKLEQKLSKVGAKITRFKEDKAA